MENSMIHLISEIVQNKYDVNQKIQNPSFDFVIFVLQELLKRFGLDANRIMQPTDEQKHRVFNEDLILEPIKAINLASAVHEFGSNIFIDDFSTIDILYPGHKKTQRVFKMLSNFYSYTTKRYDDNKDRFFALDNRQNIFDGMLKEKHETLLQIGITKTQIDIKVKEKKQCDEEQEQLTLEIKKIHKKENKLDETIKQLMLRKQEALKRHNDLKDRALKLKALTGDLQSQVVASPEELKAKSKELENLLIEKKEERSILQDSISRKKTQIQVNENAVELVNSINNSFLNKSVVIKKLKAIQEKLDKTEKQISLLETDIENFDKGGQLTSSDNSSKHEELLAELNNQILGKTKEQESEKLKIKNAKQEIQKLKLEIQNEYRNISEQEKNATSLVQNYKEVFDDIMKKEQHLRNVAEAVLSIKEANKNQ